MAFDSKRATGYFLEAFHACDRCGVRSTEAWYNRRTGALLTFCTHHSMEHARVLIVRHFKVIMSVKPKDAA